MNFRWFLDMCLLHKCGGMCLIRKAAFKRVSFEESLCLAVVLSVVV